MLASLDAFLTLLSLVSSVASSPATANGGVVSFKLLKNRLTPHTHLEKRLSKDGVGVSLANEFVWYGIKLQIGTPPQDIELQIDTGSSDTWVASQFNSAQSSTFNLNSTDPFSITYGDGTTATGNYAQDTIAISGTDALITNANFAYAPDSLTSPQVCGVGFVENESTYYGYSNFPVQLREQGQIQATMYSIFIGTQNQEGSIVFGGVDSSKYSGSLQTVPLVSESQFMVNVDSVGFEGETVYDEPMQVLLDSGTTAMLLPEDLVDKMLDIIDTGSQGHSVNCSSLNNDKAFHFNFSGAQINVPFRNLVDARSYNPDGTVPTSGECGVGFQVATSTIVLGDRFLMGAYVVFDLDSHEVSLANSVSNSTGSLQPVSTPGKIPGAVNAPGYSGKDRPQVQPSSSVRRIPTMVPNHVMGGPPLKAIINAAESTRPLFAFLICLLCSSIVILA